MEIENIITEKVEADGVKPMTFSISEEAKKAFDRLRGNGAKHVRRSVLTGTQWQCVEYTVS